MKNLETPRDFTGMINPRWQLLMLLLISFVGLFFSIQASAQSVDFQPLLDRLERIERDVKTLNVQISNGLSSGGRVSAGNTATARIAVRLTDLEEELRATTGKVETIVQQVEVIGSRLDVLIADIDYRLNAIEKFPVGSSDNIKASPLPGSVQQISPGSDQPGVLGTLTKSEISDFSEKNNTGSNIVISSSGANDKSEIVKRENEKKPDILPEGTPEDRYAYAVGLLRRGDYDLAEQAFNEFMLFHPENKLENNARYWLAESYYARGQYVQAAEFFMKGYQTDPSATKAPDMLLKLGMSLSRLDKKTDACASFAKLIEDFPKISKRILKKIALERKKISCE